MLNACVSAGVSPVGTQEQGIRTADTSALIESLPHGAANTERENAKRPLSTRHHCMDNIITDMPWCQFLRKD